MKISVVVVALNEELNIRRCLESVKDIADEMLVVDSCSEDKTTDIARSLGAIVIEQPFLGYIEQKNFATGKAKNDWVLSLDADEALSDELRTSIKAIFPAPKADGYSMNRFNNYCGTWVRHSGWYPDVKLRLYDRRKGAWAGVNPHDQYILHPGATSHHLKGDLLHYSYTNFSDHLKQIDRFSRIGALAMFDKGIRSSIAKILYKPLARFVRHYIIKKGFLDGLTGFIIAMSGAHVVFLKYLRLYYLHKGKTL